ncbi:MAG: AAA family ATPase, partial [Deltaproteobacteria bacterium]|nr:AAA family ATPase [Deltaproteobacteria bacterium]
MMQCPDCGFENPEGMQFCGRCGLELGKICPACEFLNPSPFRFCGKCGAKLDETGHTKTSEPETHSERKYATVLFSDLTGYTALSEKLDPEEVQEVMSRIFGEIAQVVARYEGFIEKFIGDAVMALFGVPKAHEDDPVRAIRAAREIHDAVGAMGPRIEEKFGVKLSMHSGINTGLVVTGKAIEWEGAHGVTGDAVNMASRLSDKAEAGEILVGPATYRLAEKYFDFHALAPAEIKGKAGTVQIYSVLSAKKAPVALRGLSGLRAGLIGRKVELSRLHAAFKRLKKGKGGMISICGGAGKGKSRLIHEFKSALDQDGMQWIQGHAYAYSRK